MSRMIIGVDPHKASVTIEVVDQHGMLAATGRFPTARGGYQALMRYVKQWPHRTWAVEGAGGAGRPLALRLVRDGERILDVPAKLAARVRVFDTGQGRKTDATDAHSIAAVAVHTRGLRELALEDVDLEVMRLLVDRRDELAHLRVQLVNRLHRLLTELIPGGARKRDLSAMQARRMLAGVRPRDPAGATRRRLAMDLVGDLDAVDSKLKTLKTELRVAVRQYGSRLMDLHGIGPAGAARLLVDVATITRFPSKGHFASWNGTAPLDASSGEQIRHRLSRAGNRRINHVLHIMAIVQLRNDTLGRAYYRRLLARGKTPMEALRCLKRRLSDVVYRQMLADQLAGVTNGPVAAGPGGHTGARTDSSADDLTTPTAASSDKSLPGPATDHATPDTPSEDRGEEPQDEDDLTGPVETLDLPAVALLRRASAGAGPGLPLNSPARGRRGSTVKGGPKGRRTATRSALEGGGADPYQRGASTPRAADSKNTGGEAATHQDLQPRPTNEAPHNPLT
jgi:transposase